eukprot:m51a1_g6947 hypothetical protein (739) ;mRNA; f:750-9720
MKQDKKTEQQDGDAKHQDNAEAEQQDEQQDEQEENVGDEQQDQEGDEDNSDSLLVPAQQQDQIIKGLEAARAKLKEKIATYKEQVRVTNELHEQHVLIATLKSQNEGLKEQLELLKPQFSVLPMQNLEKLDYNITVESIENILGPARHLVSIHVTVSSQPEFEEMLGQVSMEGNVLCLTADDMEEPWEVLKPSSDVGEFLPCRPLSAVASDVSAMSGVSRNAIKGLHKKTFEGESLLQRVLRKTAMLYLGRTLVARLLFAEYLLDCTQQSGHPLTPEEFVYCQFNGGIGQVLVPAEGQCKSLTLGEISAVVPALVKRIVVHTRGLGMFWVVDEANELASLISSGEVVSQIGSSLLKREYAMHLIARFPMCRDPRSFLEGVLNLEGVELDIKQLEQLQGRFRTITTVVSVLLARGDGDVVGAINQAAVDMSNQLCASARDFATRFGPTFATDLFSRIVASWDLCGKTLDWEMATTQGASELVQYLCTVETAQGADSSGVLGLRLAEPLAIKALRSVLPASVEHTSLVQRSTSLLANVVKLLGVECSVKGNLLEPIVHRVMQSFNGTKVADLPILRNLQDLIEGASGVTGARQGMLFLAQRVPRALLVEYNQTRQDGAWFFDRMRAGAIGMTISVGPIKGGKHFDQVDSTDIRQSFRGNKGLQDEFRALNGHLLDSILRIHIELPRTVPRYHSQTYIKGNDIMVFITLDNMDEFFVSNTGNTEWDNAMFLLKSILKDICG